MSGHHIASLAALLLLSACPEVPTALEECPGVDLVFIMDTSGSMEDEGEALCDTVADVESNLEDEGLAELRVTRLGILKTPTITEAGRSYAPDAFDCLTNTVYRVAGGDGVNHPQVPGDPPGPVEIEDDGGDLITVDSTQINPDEDEADEYWASAVALIADGFDWLGQDVVRLTVPLSDEAPATGQSSCWPVDTTATDNTVAVASAAGVLVSPIIGAEESQDVCVPELGQVMADGTGGTRSLSESAADDLPLAIRNIVQAACAVAVE